MLRSNIRLIFGGLAALALGLAGGWASLAVFLDESSAPTMQTSAVARPVVPDTREPSPSTAAPPPDSEPATPPTKVEPVSSTPAPARVVETVPPKPAAGTASPARLPEASPTGGKHTKVPVRVSAKWRARLRDDDDDDDC